MKWKEVKKEDAMKTKCVTAVGAVIILLGPGTSMGQWVQSFESYRGGVCALGQNGSTVYAGAVGGEIFSSTDKGETWSLITSGEIKNAVTSVVASDSMTFAATNGGGIFGLKAGGTGWTKLDNGLSDTTVNVLLVEGNRSVVAGTQHGTFTSTDNGATWTSRTSVFGGNAVLSLFQNDLGLFAGTSDGRIYFSSDSGVSWAGRGAIASHGITGMETLANKLFAATADSGVFVSIDGGFNWASSDSGLQNLNLVGLTLFNTTLIAVTWMGQEGGFVSANAGGTWSPATNLSDSMFTAVMANGDNLYISSNQAGVLRSTDGGTSWSQVNLGGITNYYIGAFARVGTDIFAGTQGGGVLRTTDLGKTWSSSGLTYLYVNCLAGNDSLLLGGMAPGIWRTSDRGVTWSVVDSDWNGMCYHILFHDSTVYSAYGFNIHVSCDGGLTWKILKMPSSLQESVNDVAVIDSTIFAGSGLLGVLRKTVDDSEWSFCESSASYAVICMIARDSTLFVGTANGVYRSTDHGVDWVSAGLASDYVYTLVPYGKYLFAGTYQGIYFSSNDGATWTFAGQGLNRYVEAIIVMDSTVYAGTSGGVYARTFKDIMTGIKWGDGQHPTSYTLMQNYPNPFNPATVIGYQLPMNSLVTLKIYDVLGRDVQTLVNGSQRAGSYSIPFNAGSLPSGVYFYRLQAGSFTQTKKLVLMK